MASHWTSTASSIPGAWWGKSHPSSLPVSYSFPAFIERTLFCLTVRSSISSLARQREEKRWLRRQKVSLVSSGTGLVKARVVERAMLSIARSTTRAFTSPAEVVWWYDEA
jgi:hypothetical protein